MEALGKITVNEAPRAAATKANITTCDCIKLKSFCAAEDAINNTKRSPRYWAKIFANHMSNKGLVSKIHEEPIPLSNKNSVKNGQRT